MIKRRVPLIIAVLVCLCASTGYAQVQRTGPARQAWEYRVVEIATVESYTAATDIQKLLNQGGAEGWELIRVSDTRYYFKRPR
jgi:hypothetical protein